MSRPNITSAQVVAMLVAGVPVLANLGAAFGVFVVTPNEQHAMTEALQWGGVFAGVLVGADAHLRSQRNHADAKVRAAHASAFGPSRIPRGMVPADGRTLSRTDAQAAWETLPLDNDDGDDQGDLGHPGVGT